MDDLTFDCFDEFTIRFIRSKVHKLIGKAGITKSDYPDLLQDFARDLIQRSKNFNPATANREAFVVVVCENCVATILEHRRAERRSYKREAGSLNRLIQDAEGDQIEFGSTIHESQHARRNGQYRRSPQEMYELTADVTGVLDQMSPLQRKVCEMLMRESKAAVVRKLGISWWSFYEILHRILAQFEKAGLRDYLK